VGAFEQSMQQHILNITQLFECEYRVLHTDGNWRVIQSRGKAVRDSQGKATRLIGILIDVTRTHQMEQTIVAMERTQATLRSIGDALLVTDITGCLTYMNEIAERLTGWKLSEAKGIPLGSILRCTTKKRENCWNAQLTSAFDVVGE